MTSEDQMGFSVVIKDESLRIISLVPSITELLVELGLEKDIVGITRFCIHPKKVFKETPKIGGTKEFDFEKIDELNPTLIIGNKEENYIEGIKSLKENYPVWMSDVNNFSDALEMIRGIGEITHRSNAANALIKRIEANFQSLNPLRTVVNTLYLIWNKPLMAVGGNNFINDMLVRIGCNNIASSLEGRYPNIDSIRAQFKPDLVLLSSEPYPFKEFHLEEIQAVWKDAKIVLVDGEMFSWYGSRMEFAPKYFNDLVLKNLSD